MDRVWLANASSNSGYVEEIVDTLTDVGARCEQVRSARCGDGCVAKIEIRQGEGRFHLQYGNERQFPLSLPTPGRFLPRLGPSAKAARSIFLRALLQRKLLYRGVDQELVYEIESKSWQSEEHTSLLTAQMRRT